MICPYTNLVCLDKQCSEIKDCDYRDGFEQGRADAIDDRANLLAYICKKYNIPLLDMNCTVDEWEESKEQKNDKY